MSNKYSWSGMDGGTIHTSTDSGSEYLRKYEIAKRMNKMQDVVNTARTASREWVGDDLAENAANLIKALDALTPKSIEQLRKERDEAADELAFTVRSHCVAPIYNPDLAQLQGKRRCYEEATAAHIAAVNK